MLPPEELSAGIGLLHLLEAEIEVLRKTMETILTEKTWLDLDHVPDDEALVQLAHDCWQREIDAIDNDPSRQTQKRQRQAKVFW